MHLIHTSVCVHVKAVLNLGVILHVTSSFFLLKIESIYIFSFLFFLLVFSHFVSCHRFIFETGFLTVTWFLPIILTVLVSEF